MDIGNMNLEELSNLRDKINYRKSVIEEEQFLIKKNSISEKINKFRENKDLILSLLDHGRTSCDDYNNGIDDEGHYRCAKCALKHILENEYDDYDITFNVEIEKIQKDIDYDW
jgi:hypothetical protein